MVSRSVQALILAAGKSSRCKTGRSKLLEKICGRPMIAYPVKIFEALAMEMAVVVGYQAEQVQEAVQALNVPDVSFVLQKEQRGTGDAVLASRSTWKADHVLILNGDSPLVSQDLIQELMRKHTESGAALTFVTAHYASPSQSYGRVIEEDGHIKIVEAKEFTGDSEKYCCINAGVYLIERAFLESSIDEIGCNATAQEWYLTDLVKIASDKGRKVETVRAPFDRVRGVNTLEELWMAEQIVRADLIKRWMEQGVRFSVPQTVHIECDVTIGAGSHIGAGVQLMGDTKIGANCLVDAYSLITNSLLEDDVCVASHSVVTDSVIKKGASVGPFAHVREHTVIHEKASIGNFVEVKKSQIGAGTRAKHLTYLGDARIGSGVNIGAGTITCNYNGITKEQTVIGDGAFIGSNNTLIAPVSIGKDAFTAGGSVITHDVADGDLAFGRARQVTQCAGASRVRTRVGKHASECGVEGQ